MAKKNICELAVKEFGLTDDFYEAGYILRDGRMLDFSGKKFGGDPGHRALDHRQITKVTSQDKDIADTVRKHGTDTPAVYAFLDKCGAVRVSTFMNTNQVYAEMIHKPTNAQMKILDEYSKDSEYTAFERIKPKIWESICSYRDESPPPGFVRAFVADCFHEK